MATAVPPEEPAAVLSVSYAFILSIYICTNCSAVSSPFSIAVSNSLMEASIKSIVVKILSSFPTSFDDALTVVATSAFTLTGLTVTPGIDVPTKAIVITIVPILFFNISFLIGFFLLV